jgi:hypothetical protein
MTQTKKQHYPQKLENESNLCYYQFHPELPKQGV